MPHLTLTTSGQVRISDAAGDPYPLVIESTGEELAVELIAGSDGDRRELESVGEPEVHRFVVDAPEDGSADWQLRFRRTGTKAPPAVSLEPAERAERTTRLAWTEEEEHGLFVVTVLGMPRADHIFTKTVATAWTTIPWARLEPGSDYRVVVREHDGREVVRWVCEFWLQADDAGFPTELSDKTKLIAEFKQALSQGGGPVPAGIIGLTRSDDSVDMARGICRALYDISEVTPRIYLRPRALNYSELGDAARRLADRPDGSRFARDALSYLALWGVIDEFFEASGLRGQSFVDGSLTPDQAEALLERIRASPAHIPDSFSSAQIEGLVLSCYDRDAASASLSAAREANPLFWDHLEFDTGAATYFSHAELADQVSTVAERRDGLAASFTIDSALTPWQEGEYLYACSCDRKYFRIYYPVWLAVADYLKSRRMRFHFVLCGERSETGLLLEEAQALRRTLGTLRGRDPEAYADNVSFSSVEVPEYVAKPATFYACARFLCARQLGELFQGPLIMSDVDFFFRDDPKRYLASIDFSKVGVSSIRGMEAVRPWRRVLGGTLVLPQSDATQRFLSWLEEYVLAGLHLERNWMLDQNALNYSVEQVRARGDEDIFFDLNRLARPTVGEKIRTMCEGAQQRIEAANRPARVAGRPADAA